MKLQWFLFNVALIICFNAQAQSFQDCTGPFPICGLKTYHFEEMKGHGSAQDVLPHLRCISNKSFKETNSKWLYFEVEESGTLTFNIKAKQEGDDIDFIIFEIEGDCSSLNEVRCMASGKDYINKRNAKTNCIGNTGLNYNSLDDFEKSGCKYSDDNMLKFLSARQGERYTLLINNYDSEKGFSISFDGDCQLRKADDCMPLDLNLTVEKLFPNPTSETLIAQINSIADTYKLQILDASGKVFIEEIHKCNKGYQTLNIDASRLLSGMYILRITQSELSASKTFVKEN